MAVLLPLIIASNIYILSMTVAAPGEFPIGTLAFLFAVTAVQAFAFASIAVNWHRYVLLDEMPVGLQRLRVDGVVWRYAGNLLLVFLIFFLCALPFGFVIALVLSAFGKASFFLAIPAYIALAFAAISAFYRLGVKFPAIALERRDFGFGDAWRITRGTILSLRRLFFHCRD